MISLNGISYAIPKNSATTRPAIRTFMLSSPINYAILQWEDDYQEPWY